MADDPTVNSVRVAADDITTVNGGALGYSAYGQRIKVDSVGTDGAHTDTSLTNPFPVRGTGGFDVQASFTRPADTTAYTANDAMSDSTSAPTTGGFTLSGVARASGGLVMLTDVLITSSKAATLQGFLYIFNQATTNNNDNAAFALSDSDVANLVAVVPFVLAADVSNSWQHIQNLAIVAACSGSADLRFIIRVSAAYTPDNAEVIKVRAKGLRLN